MSSAKQFLQKHGIYGADDYAAYHYSFALYLCYLIEAMKQAEDIRDGMYFEEEEVSALFAGLKEAKEAMQTCRKKTDLAYPEFDPAETITLKGCRIENGKIIGNEESAEKIARKWIEDYLEMGKNPYCFEVAVYILFLLHEDVNYSFLIRNGERKR